MIWQVFSPNGEKSIFGIASTQDEAIRIWASTLCGKNMSTEKALDIWNGKPKELGYTCKFQGKVSTFS